MYFDHYDATKAPDSFSLYVTKRRHEVGEISLETLTREWQVMSKEQKAEFQNQSQCIQFTLDIDQRTPTVKPSMEVSSMVIPSHSPEPSNPPAPSPFQPELPYSAAAEAAALTSLSFHIPKTSPLTKRRYGILPQKVKRPPNAYLLFNRDMRRQLHDDNQGLSSGEISKTISLRWKQLSPAEKEYYLNEESKLKQQHTNSIYSRRSKAELKEAGVVERKKPDIHPAKKPSLVIAGRDPRGRKKKKADDSLPKHPMSAYLHFAKEIRPIMKRRYPEARLVDISREIGYQWRSMSPLELQPWVEIANRDKERYANEMKERILQQEHQQTMIEDTCSSSGSSTSSPISIQHFPLDHHYRAHPIV